MHPLQSQYAKVTAVGPHPRRGGAEPHMCLWIMGLRLYAVGVVDKRIIVKVCLGDLPERTSVKVCLGGLPVHVKQDARAMHVPKARCTPK